MQSPTKAIPLQPNVIERFLIDRGTVPGLMLDLALPTFQVWAMIGAMETGLFEHVAEAGPIGVERLAERTGASERGIERRLHLLPEPVPCSLGIQAMFDRAAASPTVGLAFSGVPAGPPAGRPLTRRAVSGLRFTSVG